MINLKRKNHGPSFAVGCGRSGTHFLTRIFQEDPSIASYHLDTVGEATGDSFLEYCEWNRLPVDLEGFFQKRKELIDQATVAKQNYFESNPYLSLSINSLFERFSSNIIVLVRKPEDVVNSHYVKGWYQNNPIRNENEKALGYQYNEKLPNHSFGRIVPNGDEFDSWLKLTRIGKIAWMWNTINKEIKKQLSNIPENNYRSIKLEEIDFNMYIKLHSFIGGGSAINKNKFDEIINKKPGKGPLKHNTSSWSKKEKKDFFNETEEMRGQLGY